MTPCQLCGEHMERSNEESEKWRIDMCRLGVCDSVGVAAIEERSARLV